jgi:hypothetical protein
MMNTKAQEYMLTVVQHTYCNDCMWLKGKITDVYHASGIVRGEDSKQWRMQILSPPWERAERARDFPKGFSAIDVPALKLEVGGRLVFATHNPGLINQLLDKLKWMLIKRHSNVEVGERLVEIVKNWVDSVDEAACPVG